MILEEHNFSREALANKVVLITGGGGGIGYEATRAFSYMGAKVIVAELNAESGTRTQDKINDEFGNTNVDFYQTDLADESQINALCEYVISTYARVDVLVNNAAVVPMGAAEVVSISDWDLSYAVNLRAPVILLKNLLPHMRKMGGVIVFNPSGPGAYMSAYEIFKTAQVELCNALDVELSETGIITYGVAPGFVKTDTCVKAVETVASSMGMAMDEFYSLVEDITEEVEVAGIGYAVSVVHAERYKGQVTFSHQVLVDAGLLSGMPQVTTTPLLDEDNSKRLSLLDAIASVFDEQYNNWMTKNLFFRQFVLNDFKKQMGTPAQAFKRQLEDLHQEVQNGQWDKLLASKDLFVKLQSLYAHQRDLLSSFEKDPVQLKNDTALMNGWIATLGKLIESL